MLMKPQPCSLNPEELLRPPQTHPFKATCKRTPCPALIASALLPCSQFNPQVREVAQEAIERARRGDGPTLIEAETYRFRGHSLADPDELRSKEEKAKYAVSAEDQW